MRTVKKLNVKKLVLTICFTVLLFFSIFNVGKVLASNTKFELLDITIEDKSPTTDASIIDYENDSAKVSVVFHKINDYVVYKLLVKNISGSDFVIDKIVDNESSPYVEYEYDTHEDEDFKKNTTKELTVKATYKTEVTSTSERNQIGDFKLTNKFKDNGEEDIDIITPKTGDNIYLFVGIGVISLFGLIYIFTSKKKNTKKHAKHMLFVILLLPVIIRAYVINFDILFDSTVKLHDKLVVTVDNNGTIEEVVVPYGETTTEPAHENREGYNFDGYYVGNTPYDFSEPLEEDVSIEARYTPINYDINYDLGGGTSSNPTTYNIESDTITLSDPTLEGYDFVGWTGSNGTTPQKNVTIETGNTGAKSYTANYTPTNYSITYNLDGGSVSGTNEISYTIESSDITLINPTKTGYDFAGWTGSNGDTPETSVTISTGSTGNKTYTANYTPSTHTAYTVNHKYEELDGSWKNEPQVLYGTTGSNVTPSVISRTGFIDAATSQITILASGDASVDYLYYRDSRLLTISNEEYVSTTTPSGSYPYETSITLTRVNREGYNFTGWSNGESGTSITFDLTTNTNVGPEYEPITYDITYNLNGGSVSGTNETSYTIESSDITLINPTLQGYDFIGWTGSNGDEPQMSVTIPSGSTGNKSYTANFDGSEGTKYYVNHKYETLNGTYDTEVEELTGKTGTHVTPVVRHRNGFGDADTSEIEILPTGDASVDYVYNRIRYNLTINNSAYVDTTFNLSSYPFETEVTMTAIDRDGYNFVDWSNEETTKTITFTMTDDVEIGPNYELINYTITYNLDGGSVSGTNETSYNVESTNITLINPTKTGYDFAGWTGSNGDEPETSVTIPTGSTGNKTYTANYTPSTHTAYTVNHKYEELDGSWKNEPQVLYGTTGNNVTPAIIPREGFIDATTSQITILASGDASVDYLYYRDSRLLTISNEEYVSTETPSGSYPYETSITLTRVNREGYNFTGWSNGESGTSITFDLTTNTNVGPEYEPITYNITYNLNDGSVSGTNETSYTIESSNITLINPTKTGYDFAGWTGSNGDTPETSVTIPTGSTGNKSYTANYTPGTHIAYTVNHKYEELDGSYTNEPQVLYGTTGNSYTPSVISRTGFVDATTDQVTVLPNGDASIDYVYNRIRYNIIFDSNGGSSVTSPVEYMYGQTIGTLPETTQSGYNFAGWFNDDTDEEIESDYVVTSAITITAHWDSVGTILCRKTTTLHTETCDRSSAGCYTSGFYPTGTQGTTTITYGNIASYTPVVGDAYDCDVDGEDGFEADERFYYMGTSNGKALMLYYSNIDSNGLNNAEIFLYTDIDGILDYTDGWTNVDQISEGVNARIPTTDEISAACPNTNRIDNGCRFILENTQYHTTDKTKGRSAEWLQMDGSTYMRIHTTNLNIAVATNGASSSNGVRPMIEVPLDRLEVSYMVTYDANGGTVSKKYENVPVGGSVATHPTPEKEGYLFEGWYTQEEGGELVSNNYTPTGDITLHAHYKKSIALADIADTNIVLTISGSTQITINNIAEIGETFTYSNSDDNVATVDESGNISAVTIGHTTITITGDISESTVEVNVHVVEEGSEFILVLDPDNGEDDIEIHVTPGEGLTNLPEPTKTDYTFDGWFADNTFAVEYTEGYVLEGNRSGIAKWVPNSSVAEVGTANYYDSIKEAFAAVPSNTKTNIRLLKDVTTFGTKDDLPNVADNQNIVFDLDGHTISNTSVNYKLVYNKGTLEIKNGTLVNNQANNVLWNEGTMVVKNLTVNSSGNSGALNNTSSCIMTVIDTTVNMTGARQAIYNDGGTLYVRGNTTLYNKKDRAALHNLNGGHAYVESGTITSDSTLGAIKNENGIVEIGVEGNGLSTTNPVIIGKTRAILSEPTDSNATVVFKFYDGILKSTETDVIDDRTKFTLETNSNFVDGTDGDYYTVTLAITGQYEVTLDPTSGTVDPTSLHVDIGNSITSLPTPDPLDSRFTFLGWYDDEDAGNLIEAGYTPTGNITLYARWQFVASSEIVEHRTTNDAMKTYYQYIDTWKSSSSNFPSWSTNNKSPNWALDATENTAMMQNFVANNCQCADNQCSSSGTVACDKPIGYDTGFNKSISVYESSETNKEKGTQVTYAKVVDGVIYDLIPGRVYYWEVDDDNSIHGYVRFNSERRILETGDVRNVRDLGGLPVDTDGNGTIDGHLAYGRLFRGIKLNTQSSKNELERLGINSELDLREANSDTYKISRYNRIEAQNYYVNPFNYVNNPNNTTLQEKQYYDMTRAGVKYAMEEIVANKNLYFHCRIGTDRTGTVAWVLEGLLGVPEEDRIQDYELSFFYGLVRIHRYHDEKPGSSVGTGKERFVYMHNFMATNQQIYEWYMHGSTNVNADNDLIQAFRAAMIE